MLLFMSLKLCLGIKSTTQVALQTVCAVTVLYSQLPFP